MISKNGQILVEVKRLTWVDPGREAFSGKGAKQLLGMCSKSAIGAIYGWCDNFQQDESKNGQEIPLNSATMPNAVSVVPHWSSKRSDSAYDAGITFTFTFKDGTKDGTKVTLYQLDSYLLDLYYGNCKYVIRTNGLVWKIFGNKTLKPKEFHLDKNYGYIPPLSKDDPLRIIVNPSKEISTNESEYGMFVQERIQIDPNEFNDLINCLKRIFSTL